MLDLPDESDPRADPPRPASPVPFLNYSSRPPPPLDDTAVMDLLHGLGAMAVHLSLIGAMKVASMHWRWDVGAICGVWIGILVLNLGLAGWLYGAFGWRGVMTGTVIAMLISLIAAPFVLGG